jgi:Rod binding domain-containing protein
MNTSNCNLPNTSNCMHLMPASPSKAAPPSAELKLRKAAGEFESMLLSKWWSSMRESGLGGLDETDPGHDTLDQLGMQALSTAVAGAGVSASARCWFVICSLIRR